MDNQSIIETLKKVEEGYNSWDDSDIENQIEAINECGYEWFEEDGRVGFKHSQSGIYLNDNVQDIVHKNNGHDIVHLKL